jgi:hypothetical protein
MQETCSNLEHAHERSAADERNPLHQSGILQLVLDLVGPGEHLLLATVSKSFRACYQNVPAVKTMYQDEQGIEVELMLVHEMTAFGAVLCSPSRVQLAAELGIVPDFSKGWSQFLAGFSAGIETLQELHKQYQMTYTETVCRGAASSGSVSKLQWLVDEQHCSQPSDLDCFAVHAPTTDVLDWLKHRGCVYTAETCAAAARCTKAAQMLEYLHSVGAPFDAKVMTEAIAFQKLPLLQWLCEHGCPLSEEAVIAALKLEDLSVLNWLHSKHCPANYGYMCHVAASLGKINTLQWAKDNGVVDWSSEVLSVCLNIAGVYGQLNTAEVRDKFLLTSTLQASLSRMCVILYFIHEVLCHVEQLCSRRLSV